MRRHHATSTAHYPISRLGTSVSSIPTMTTPRQPRCRHGDEEPTLLLATLQCAPTRFTFVEQAVPAFIQLHDTTLGATQSH